VSLDVRLRSPAVFRDQRRPGEQILQHLGQRQLASRSRAARCSEPQQALTTNLLISDLLVLMCLYTIG